MCVCVCVCVCACVSNSNLPPYISCIQVATVTSNLNDVTLCFSLKNQVCFFVLPSNIYFKVSCSKGKFIFSGILSNNKTLNS